MSKETFNTKQVATLYNVADQTVRLWCREFSAYLSPDANPGERKRRVYNSDDMAVFDFIFRQRERYKNYDEIKAMLAGGQRGVAPETLPEDIDRVKGVETEKRLAFQANALRSQLEVVSHELDLLREVHDDNIELRTEIRLIREQLQETQRLASERLEQNQSLQRQIGSLEAKLDLLREQFLGDDKRRR